MGLIELCLLSLLSPQEPNLEGHANAATAPATTQNPTGHRSQTGEDQDPRAQLRTAEAAGEQADGDVLTQLTTGDDAEVATRAAWLIGKTKGTQRNTWLTSVITTSPHPDARLQALQALRRQADVTATSVALRALNDDDRRVRTVAVQLLGKLRRPASVDPLLMLLSKPNPSDAKGAPATDVQAALLTLADLGATQHLLRMATAVADNEANDAGTALTYAFQTLSPQLSNKDETTVLVAVLAHREDLLRRYAITRLTELESATALSALNDRLANEGDELRPLLEVAIAQLRHDSAAPPKDEVARAKANAMVLWTKMRLWWQSLEPLQQGLVGSSPVVLFALIWLLRRAGRRRAHQEDALAATAMVQPSDEYLDQQEDEYDEDYEDDDEYDEHEQEEGDFESGFDDDQDEIDDQQEFDTSGWDEDEEQTVPTDEGNPEDELFR